VVKTFTRKRIDVLVDAPLSDWLVETAAAAGIAHFSFLPVHAGRGRGGSWHVEDGFGTVAKYMFVALTNGAKLEQFLTLLAPDIEKYGLVIAVCDVEVIRGERF
jgi:hypothetical protein